MKKELYLDSMHDQVSDQNLRCYSQDGQGMEAMLIGDGMGTYWCYCCGATFPQPEDNGTAAASFDHEGRLTLLVKDNDGVSRVEIKGGN